MVRFGKIIIALLLFIPLHIQAVIFVDVGEFNFPTEGRQGTRLVVFDTEKQSFIHIGYYAPPTTRVSDLTIPCDVTPFRFFYNGDVDLREKENKENVANYMVRTKGTIKGSYWSSSETTLR